MIIRYKNPRGESGSFNSDSHVYWSGNDTDEQTVTMGEMIPVTKLIAQFYQVHPWNNANTDFAFGRRVHTIVAECLNGNAPSIKPLSDRERMNFSAAWRFAKRIKDYNDVKMVESVVFSKWCGVAGTIDLVFVCNGQTFVCDWKTGDITMPAKCKFNAPFAHLVADPLTIYSLQCSMYQVLMDVGGYAQNAKFAPARLLWLHNGEDGMPKVDALTCRDLRREAAEMIAMRSYTPWFVDWQRRCPW